MAQRLEKNTELIEWAYNNLEGIPKGSDDYERLISGMSYNCWAPELNVARLTRHERARRYGDLSIEGKSEAEFMKERYEYIKSVFGKVGANVYLEPPFNVDYGFNISVGDNFYANFNLTILDCSVVKIGNNCMTGPNVTITCATHPVDPYERNVKNVEWAREIIIGDNVWITTGVVICQGTVIGNGVTLGANCVIPPGKTVPDNCVVAGNPARIIKKLKGYVEPEPKEGVDYIK
ncbi:CYFA0S10e03818g1_1 [Cyberlindnera fabianii]|uniref:CYFA0S10e03818g1_1 n=1 Tax=Cyberlindnera fabianii TaxID=36022 RepID=A0A061B7P4_CYBFA|nr:CYFA0S10e03818g1_1 [Cyberlindnera fabianii]